MLLKEELKEIEITGEVWCVNGHDDEGDWEPEIYSIYKKARKSFEDYIEEYNICYGKYNEEKEEYEPVCIVENDFASYDCGNHYGTFWISKVKIR